MFNDYYLFLADRRTKSLGAVKPHYKAEHGHPGAKNNSSGKNGAHTIVKVSPPCFLLTSVVFYISVFPGLDIDTGL